MTAHPRFIPSLGSLRSIEGHTVEQIGGGREIPAEMLFGSMNRIAAACGRLDTDTVIDFHARCDAEVLSAYAERNQGLPPLLVSQYRRYLDGLPADLRADAAGVSAQPRSLEWIRAQVLEEVRPELNADMLFPADTSVPLGYREHTYTRRTGWGQAILTRGDTTKLGSASTGTEQEKFPVVYIICSVRQTYFEMLANNAQGLDQYRADLRMAYRLVAERKNRAYWNGDVGTQLPGALNFPDLSKKTMTTVFGGPSATAPEIIVRHMHQLVDAPARYSSESASPDTLAVSPNIFRHISQTKHSSTGGTDITIKDFFQGGQDETNGIRRIVKAHELTGIGPNGEDGLLAFRSSVDSAARIEVAPTMTLPVYQESALSWLTVVMAAIGGVVMPNAGHNILGLASAPNP